MTKLCVGNLLFSATEESIRALFAHHAPSRRASSHQQSRQGPAARLRVRRDAESDAPRAMQALTAPGSTVARSRCTRLRTASAPPLTTAVRGAAEVTASVAVELPPRRVNKVIRILIVDHDAESARQLARLLPNTRYDLVVLQGASESALEAAIEFDPDLVILDIELPEMSGYEAARRLRQHPNLQHARLIALTESGEHLGREHARVSGFERYLVKPVTGAAVEELLASLSP